MKKLLPAFCALGLALFAGQLHAGSPYEVPHKSVSSSQQFVVYCDDTPMRLAVTSFCETTKALILSLLSQRDGWKIPIVITLARPDAAVPGQPLTQIGLYNVEGGSRKIELNVTLRGRLEDIHFQEQLVRVVLLEMEYRGQPDWKEGVPVIEPPQWLVGGLTTYLRNRDTDMDVDVYKSLLKTGNIPALDTFLTQDTSGLDAASLKLYQAYDYSFFQLLVRLPEGPQELGAYIHDLPLGKDSPTQDLLKHFPALGTTAESVEKWWSLSVARIAASERFKGLSLEETDQRIAKILKFTIPTGKNGETKDYTIEDFKAFVKNPQARPILAKAGADLEAFAAEANPLFRPIIGEYLGIIQELQTGRAGPVAGQLKDVAKYKEMILTRMDQIADYLNWFEATQTADRSNSFDEYLKAAKELSTETPVRDDPISRYLDSLEMQMQ